jgi:hypothetical protein
MTDTPPRVFSVASAAHTALVEAARLRFSGTLEITRTLLGVSARLVGVGVVVPAKPVRWNTEHGRAVTALAAADGLQPVGAWCWRLQLADGVPAVGLRWEGIDPAAPSMV